MSTQKKKTLQDLTPEIKAKIPKYIKRYTEGIFDGGRYRSFRKEDAEELIDFNYMKSGYKLPVVWVAENPYEAQVMFNKVLANQDYWQPVLYKQYCEKNGMPVPADLVLPPEDANPYKNPPQKKYHHGYLFTCNVYSNSYYGWYKFIKDEFKIEAPINDDLDKFAALYMKSGVYSAIFSELLCIVSKYPTKVYRNEANLMHNPAGKACEWAHSSPETEFKCYYINGRSIPEEVFIKCQTGAVTKEDFINEKNEEIKGAYYEILGQERIMQLLGAKKISEGQFDHANGESEIVELYQTEERFAELDNQPLAWVRFTCPSTGTNYLIDVEPKWKDAKEAAISTSPFFGMGIDSVDDYRWDERA